MPRLLVKKKEEILAEYFVKKNKTKIFIATVLICLIFLGIWFYAGWATHSFLN